MNKIRFSIVIPAHNEEKYIKKTLKSAISVNYPKELFEVIVVENNSSDKTFSKIKEIKSNLIKAHHISKKGVSYAKNFGVSKANKKTDWIIFLDADTIIHKNSLTEINDYLIKGEKDNLSIGTTSLKPIEDSLDMSFWFWFYDIIHRLFSVSMSIQIAKRNLFNKLKYDERLTIGEDVDLIKRMKKLGKFFFIPTKEIYTSTRRFKKVGITKLTLQWFFAFLVPDSIKRKLNYEVIR